MATSDWLGSVSDVQAQAAAVFCGLQTALHFVVPQGVQAPPLEAVFATVAAFAFGLSVALLLGSFLARTRRVQTRGGQAYLNRAKRQLVHGFPPFVPFAKALLGARPVQRYATRIAQLLGNAQVASTPLALVSLALLLLVVVVLASWLATGSPFVGLAVYGCAAACLLVYANAAEDKRAQAMRYAVPDVFRSMESCFQAGLSLLQTLQQVARETTGPLGAVFSRAAHRLQMGAPAEDALAELRSETLVPELAFAAVALDVQHQSGGSLAQVLQAARESVEGQLALSRALRVQTAQAKFSARVVSVMPFVLLAVFSFVSPGFLEPFFASVTGVCLLVLEFAMQGAGIFFVRRMLAVEVD